MLLYKEAGIEVLDMAFHANDKKIEYMQLEIMKYLEKTISGIRFEEWTKCLMKKN